ncbi:beta strand repeat-containing protein, partial [Magnetospirillum sp. SS-4]|uniref:beta strand repeat-containing protein n=1 Tax=Magnetospirillum sp. SS-4 TaxID=2681465 RepID=UPI0034CE6249
MGRSSSVSTPPTVQSVTANAGVYTTDSTITLTVAFSENITATTTTGSYLLLSIDGQTVQAQLSATATDVNTLTYTVSGSSISGLLDSDGTISVAGLSFTAGTLKSAGSSGLDASTVAAMNVTPSGGSSIYVDGLQAQIVSVDTPVAGSYGEPDHLDFVVNFNQTATKTGSPQLQLNIGGATYYADYYSGDGTSAVTFRWEVPDASSISTSSVSVTGLYYATGSDYLSGSTSISGQSYTANHVSTTLAGVGSTSSLVIDTVEPDVSGNIAVPSNGSYKADSTLTFAVTYDEAVTVTGTPRLILTNGGTTVYATYSDSQSTSTVKKFVYTVQSGDNLAGITVGDIDLNGGSMKDTANNDAGTSLTGHGNGALASVVVDTTAPTLSSAAKPTDGVFATGGTLDYTVTYDEAVTVNTTGGTPRIALNIGGTTAYATYVSGSGTTTLTFRHTVTSGEQDNDGVTVTSSSIDLNGGLIRDTAGNNAATSLSGQTLSSTGIIVNPSLPEMDSVSASTDGPVSNLSDTNYIDLTVTFSEAVTISGSPLLNLTVGSTAVTASLQSITDSTHAVFRYTVVDGQNDSDGIAVTGINLNGGSITSSSSGQNAILVVSGGALATSTVIDTAEPVVSSVAVPSADTYSAGDVLTFSVTCSEVLTISGGSPQLSLTIGSSDVLADLDADATAAASTGSNTVMVFKYTVQAGENDLDGITVNSLVTNGAGITDDAGNSLTTTLNNVAVTTGVLVDNTAPTIDSVTLPDAGTYIEGDTLTFVLNMSEATTVSGGTVLRLDIGGQTIDATLAGGSGTDTLTFEYVIAQDDAIPTDPSTITVVSLTGGTVEDAVGNAADRTLPTIDTTGIEVDKNDDPTDIALSANQVSEADDASDSNVLIGTLSKTDPDGTGTYTYAIAEGDTGEANFVIVDDQLYLKAGVALDYEDTTSLSVAVTVSDGRGGSYREVMTVDVTDVSVAGAVTDTPDPSLPGPTLTLTKFDPSGLNVFDPQGSNVTVTLGSDITDNGIAVTVADFETAVNVYAANIDGVDSLTLIGDANDNILVGTSGADNILGGNGADTLIGGAGADDITGGVGNDVFAVTALSQITSVDLSSVPADKVAAAAAGIDIIEDFTQGEDVISLTGLGISLAQYAQGTTIFSQGSSLPSDGLRANEMFVLTGVGTGGADAIILINDTGSTITDISDARQLWIVDGSSITWATTDFADVATNTTLQAIDDADLTGLDLSGFSSIVVSAEKTATLSASNVGNIGTISGAGDVNVTNLTQATLFSSVALMSVTGSVSFEGALNETIA